MDTKFVDLLRSHLRYAGEGPIDGESALRDLGLDSMRSIELLFAIEDTYGVSIPDERLTDTTFETAGSLWAAVEELTTAAARDGDAA